MVETIVVLEERSGQGYGYLRARLTLVNQEIVSQRRREPAIHFFTKVSKVTIAEPWWHEGRPLTPNVFNFKLKT